jgi:uncharacterized membrane protein
MSDAAMTVAAANQRPGGLPALMWSLAINLVGPYFIFSLAEPHFAPGSTTPLLLSAIVPAAELSFMYLRKRVVDVIAIISLVQLAVGIAITLTAHSASAAVTGHAMTHAALGFVFGVSALSGRPLVLSLARQTMAGSDPERQARFDEIAKIDGARRVFIRLSWIWMVTLCCNSAILLVAARALPTRDYVLVSPIISYGMLGLLIWGGIRYGRYAAAKAMARR